MKKRTPLFLFLLIAFSSIGLSQPPNRPQQLQTPAPPVQVDNESTWLDQTDFVFIDPVGTSYSRGIHDRSYESRSFVETEHQNGLVRSGPYDVHRREIAREVETGCRCIPTVSREQR